MRVLFLLIFLFSICISVFSQDIYQYAIPTADKIPAGEIMCTYQDSEGYMWYGTTLGGLCRDDSYNIVSYRSDQKTPGLIESNYVTCITEDNKGRIWFGTKRGCYILDKISDDVACVSDEAINGRVITAVYAHVDSSLWIAVGNTLTRFDKDCNRTGIYNIEGDEKQSRVYKIYRDYDNSIWIVQWNGDLFRYDEKSDLFDRYDWPYTESPSSIVQDKQTSEFWIGTWGRGVVKFTPGESASDWLFADYDIYKGKDKGGLYINSIAVDSLYNYLWTTTLADICVYDITDGVLSHAPVKLPASEESRVLHAIICDRSGNMWVSGSYPGSSIFSLQENKSQIYKPALFKEITGLPIYPQQLILDNDNYWIWQYRSGLYYYDADKEDLIKHNSDDLLAFIGKSADDNILAIKGYSAIVEITYSKGKSLETLICELSLDSKERIRTLHQDRNANIWIGTSLNLYKYSRQSFQYEKVCENTGIINGICSDRKGNTYVVTEKSGLIVINSDGRSETFISSVKENYTGLSVTNNNNLWVRTDHNRLYFYNSDDNTFTLTDIGYDFTDDIISEIENDDNGNLWILTDRKLIIFNPQSRYYRIVRCSNPYVNIDKFTVFSKDTYGNIYVGGNGGICKFNEDYATTPVDRKVDIKITGVYINGENKNSASDIIELNKDDESIELFVSTLSHIDKDNIRFSYRYRNEDKWHNMPVGENHIYLTGLSLGKSTLEIKVSGVGEQWDGNVKSLTIVKMPFWYESTVAYIVYSLVVLALIFSVVYYHFKNKKNIAVINNENTQASISEDKFINQLKIHIENNISDSEYSIDNLSRDMAMSRATLYRKINTVTGDTPSTFVNNIRLNKAAQILRNEKKTVAEVAYSVGFSSPGYFTQAFKKKFGELPTKYKQ